MKKPKTFPSLKDMQPSAALQWPSPSYVTLPIVIIVITIIVALIGYGLASVNLEGSRARATTRTLRENTQRIDSVFDSYAHLLWGSTGKMESGATDEASWERFVEAFDLKDNFSGLESLGLTTGTTPQDQIITYVSPKTSKTDATIGLNIGQINLLNGVMVQAAESGKATLSDALPSLFSTKDTVKDTSTGFLMFAPYYDTSLPQTTPQERLAALRGYTVALFRGDIFFTTVFNDFDMSHTKVTVYLGDKDPKNQLYSAGTTTEKDQRTATQKISYYGKTFTIVYTFDTVYMLVWSLTYYPQILFVGGLIVGMVFAGVAGYLLRSRYQRMVYEKERDVNFAKDELLSLASHQLRTPATGVKQYLGMVLQGFAGEVPEKQRTYLERAYASNDRQLHVINDILHMAKLETGRIVLAERKFDIAKMLREVIDEQRDQAQKGEIALRMKIPSQGWIVGDSHMLWMVMENLVSNAIKYTPPEGVVTVHLVRRANRWVLTIKDTGVGIDKKDFSKLFKQFSRIVNERSEVVTGTGVGLYLAYHLTILHGGSMRVSSAPGKGSTFTVRLPRKL